MEKPIKRHKALQPLSRDHHHGLLLSWKIRQGFKKGIDFDRIMAYAQWFWKTSLQRHFEIEESELFPVLGNDHLMVRKALADHRRLARLFTSTDPEKERTLNRIEEELEKHIRFEERQLFNVIQETATPDQWLALEKVHASLHADETWKDEFWL